MLTEAEAADAVVQWAGQVCAIPPERRHPYPQTRKAALPDVASEIVTSSYQQGEVEGMPRLGIEQAASFVLTVRFQLMVEQGQTDEDAAAAQAQVYGWAAELRGSILDDASLGERLPADAAAVPYIAFDFDEPFQEYDDGTIGRVTPGLVTIAQLAPLPR